MKYQTKRRYWPSFIPTLVLTIAVFVLYGANIAWWRDCPDFGWRPMYETGPNIVAEVMDSGKEAGLIEGDTITAINKNPYSTFDKLYFDIRNTEPGSKNIYTVIRDGKTFNISIITERLGLKSVLKRSGHIYLLGLIYVLIGVLVFLMKPQAESWLFFIMTCFMGMEIGFGAPSDLIRPLWFYDIRLFIDVFIPAPMIHLAFRFPKKRSFLQKMPKLWVVPYVFSLVLFILYEITSPAYWNTPPLLDKINNIYLLSGILIFMLSMVWNFVRDTSVVIRIQSQAIFLGMFIAFFVTAVDLLIRFFWKSSLFPNPSISFAVFLIFFPLSIGYTIVKHDLFAIDVIVRRTYGYMLSTTAVIGLYAFIISILNVTFQSTEIARSPLFSILFALGVVFFFRPIHERFQGFVDRVFYRQRYDYRKTIKDISEAMISILDQEQIQKMLIGSVVKEMFLENGLLLLPDPERHRYSVQFVEGNTIENFSSIQLAEDNELLKVIHEKSDAIFRYDLDLNTVYENNREILKRTFQSFSSELMLPLKYKDEMIGIVSLGRKKSGKMFTYEDIDLLKTITNQSAIALENAKLFKENLEKGRMEEELKIAHDIQTSMLPEKAPAIEGFTIAASSIPAREVGGDFYDFIEMRDGGTIDRLGIVVGDVSGKAVSGALVMAASRSIFRVLSETHVSVEEIMNIGNVRLNSDVKKGMFVALLYAVLDSRLKTLTLSNAGQTQPIMCYGDKSEPVFIDTEGDKFPLGIIKECRYQETDVSLKRGDTIVFYTDGIVEAVNDKEEMYGFDRVLTSIEEGRELDANALMEKLLKDVSNYVGNVEQHDDLTIVVVRVD